jgi:hypothetical protein
MSGWSSQILAFIVVFRWGFSGWPSLAILFARHTDVHEIAILHEIAAAPISDTGL